MGRPDIPAENPTHGVDIPDSRPALRELRGTVEKTPDYPKSIYRFERSIYLNPSSKTDLSGIIDILDKQLKIAGKDESMKVVLNGTADKVHFKLDPRSPVKRVHIDRDARWQNDFLHALKNLQTTGRHPELVGLDFVTKGLHAVHDLPLIAQQKMMNHAIGYLRAECLQKELLKKYGNDPRVKFDIQTEWVMDTKTRIATVKETQKERKPGPGPNPDTEPAPVPPEDPGEKAPFKPDEIFEKILNLTHPKYRTGRTANFTSSGLGGLISHERPMTLSRIIQNDARGTRMEMEGCFIIEKANPANPKYYLVMGRNDPYQIGIGRMIYEDNIIADRADRGPIEKVIRLDPTSRTRTLEDIQNIFNQLP